MSTKEAQTETTAEQALKFSGNNPNGNVIPCIEPIPECTGVQTTVVDKRFACKSSASHPQHPDPYLH